MKFDYMCRKALAPIIFDASEMKAFAPTKVSQQMTGQKVWMESFALLQKFSHFGSYPPEKNQEQLKAKKVVEMT